MYNFRGFGRFLRRSFFEHRGTNYRLSPKRLGVLLLSLAVYLPVEFLTWIGLGLDELIFPRYREVSIREPVFIIGNPRSGTTFLHRLLSRDRRLFISMKTWEIMLAPSVTVRKIVRGAAKVIRILGVPIRRLLRRWERDLQQDNVIHKVRLRGPEEDEYLWIHTFSTLKIWSFAAMIEEAGPFVYYDRDMDREEKRRMMDFYHSCLQRHLFANGGEGKYYLAKNPNFSPMVSTLRERYPDARFIYLVRSPLEAVPSHLSLKEQEWQLLGDPLEPYASRSFILEESEYWYSYPLEALERMPEDQYAIVEFDRLVGNARETISEIYDRFGWEMTPIYKKILNVATENAREHESQHEYSLEEMGLSEAGLRKRFASTFERFNFPEPGINKGPDLS